MTGVGRGIAYQQEPILVLQFHVIIVYVNSLYFILLSYYSFMLS